MTLGVCVCVHYTQKLVLDYIDVIIVVHTAVPIDTLMIKVRCYIIDQKSLVMLLVACRHACTIHDAGSDCPPLSETNHTSKSFLSPREG